jgi:hypothetical protein
LIVLTWQDNSSNETFFYIERCVGSGCTNFADFATQWADTPSYTDYTTTAGQSYSYRVRAYNAGGYSPYSNVASIVAGTSDQPLPAPTNLGAQALSKSQINLTWTNNATNQDGVKIERCRGSNCTSFTQIATVARTATTYTDSGLAANAAYRYRVRAYNSAGDSPYSNTASAKTLRK